MKKITFDILHNNRKHFIQNNKNKDHVVILGNNNILISAPHGVSQVRLGKYKFREIGSLTTALYLKDSTNCYFIAKTQNNNDDANFDDISPYKNSIKKLITNNNIKYIIDIHGLASKQNCDINLGTHLGNNIKNNLEIFNLLNNTLVNNGFKVNIDQPFWAGSKTISSSIKNEFPNIWTLQIEINCSITNSKENFAKYNELLNILNEWLKILNKT